jgi:hypothetical protein
MDRVQVPLQALVSAFLGILFLQSGLDKVLDRAGNKAYIAGVFANSPLRRLSGFMLVVLTMMEVLTGVLCAAGFLSVILFEAPQLALAGSLLAALTFCALFAGQRLAKDYAGAAGLVPYFLVSLAGVVFTGSR